MLHTEQQPQHDVGGDHGNHGEGDADLEEVGVFNLVAFLAQDAGCQCEPGAAYADYFFG